MPLISNVGKKSLSQRSFAWFIYANLIFFGATMTIPFLITLTSSTSNSYDYDRFYVLPRALWSRSDRYVKGLVDYFNEYPNWYLVLASQFRDVPSNWTSWRSIGLDVNAVDTLANKYLHASPEEKKVWELQAADYSDFAQTYPITDTLATFTREQGASFVAMNYQRQWAEANPEAAKGASGRQRMNGGLSVLSASWGVPINSFYSILFETETRAPMIQQSWVPPETPKQVDFDALRMAIRNGYGAPGVLGKWQKFLRDKGKSSAEARQLAPLPISASAEDKALWAEFARVNAPASAAVPLPLRLLWIEFLGSDAARPILGLQENELFDITRYNAMAGTNYASLRETPFPLPDTGFDGLRSAWQNFIESRYPLRLIKLNVTPELEATYHQFLATRYSSLENVNRLMGLNNTSFDQFKLASAVPLGQGLAGAGQVDVWLDFVRTLPFSDRVLTSSEEAYQDFLLNKYGSLEAINSAYGWKLNLLEEAFPPFDKAYTVTYFNNETAFAWSPLANNYQTIVNFLVNQGNAIPVTLLLVVMSIIATLTVNPLAGYALSRFNLKGKDKIILFCLATSAFPAMVSAIPGYLLMRDLGLLNTFFALVLPGAASGMSIFILKGFFDSLPQELYEAATIDGAKEWQIFLFVTLPMVKPILAVNALGAFLAAYAGWEWALIICQNKDMWTLSVWLYQASQWWANTPWITSAGFVVASIPTLLVFLFCQNIIMRGIIVPSMK